MLLAKQFKASLRHLCLLLNLLEARQVQRVLQLLQGGIKVHTFLLDLIPEDLDFLLETFNPVFFLHDFMIPFLFQGSCDLVHSCPDSHVEIRDLIEEKCLK